MLLLLAAAAPASQTPAGDALAETVMARLAAVPARRTAFTEEKTLAQIDGALRSQGELIYRRPDYLEKNTTWPQPERLVIDADRLIITAGNDAPRVVDLRGQPALRALVEAMRAPLSGDLATLRRDYAVQATGTPDRWRIVLTPAAQAAAQPAGQAPLLRRVTLTGTGGDVAAIELVQSNGDEDRILVAPPAP